LKSFALQCFKKREIGAPEACAKILGFDLNGSSHQVKFLNAVHKNERKRRLKNLHELKELDDECTDIYFNNLIDTYYTNRPNEIEDMCLYEFASIYEVKKSPCLKTDFHKNCQILKNNLGFLHFKNKQFVLKIPHININDEKQTEKYFYQMILLFKPWRNEEEEILNQNKFKSLKEYFNHFIKNNYGKSLFSEFQEARLKIEKAKKYLNELDQNFETKEEIEEIEENNLAFNQHTDLQFSKKVLDSDSINKKIDLLNNEQREIFDFVNEIIDHHYKHTILECKCELKINPIKTYIGGGAGVGKSFLIETIRDSITFKLKDLKKITVATIAPTGIAANNIDGTTIHKFFKIIVTKNKNCEFYNLNKSSIKMFRELYENLFLIIADEVSMISALMLAQIIYRLEEIFPSSFKENKIVHLLFFGDLLQLKPVKGEFIFEKLKNDKLSKFLDCIPLEKHIWDEFNYKELTQNVRQKDDLEFNEMLNRIRIGNPSLSDIKKLESRVVKFQNYQEIAQFIASKNDIIYLAPKLEQIDNVNKAMLIVKKIETNEVQAQDISRKTLNDENIEILLKNSQTAGLDKILYLGINARVMLRRNLDIENGLCNGIIGTIKGIINNEKGLSTKVKIAFDDLYEKYKIISTIERFSADFELSTNIYITRKQFPLILAWAITIHKCQGMTIKEALIDLGSSIFENGMAYVALSRIKSFKNLYLSSFDPATLVCNAIAILEINRLRKKFCPNLKIIEEFNTIQKTNSLKRVYYKSEIIINQIQQYKIINDNNNSDEPDPKKPRLNIRVEYRNESDFSI
ncbi:unnamed protein product, partial [Brachionus calyciflorus]